MTEQVQGFPAGNPPSWVVHFEAHKGFPGGTRLSGMPSTTLPNGGLYERLMAFRNEVLKNEGKNG